MFKKSKLAQIKRIQYSAPITTHDHGGIISRETLDNKGKRAKISSTFIASVLSVDDPSYPSLASTLHQKPLILFPPEASFFFDNVALLPCQVMRPTVCQVLAPSQRMQVCTPSRDHRKKEKGTKLSARTIFSTMIELSSRFLTASPSTRCWDSYGTFVTPLKLGSLYAAGTWPYNAARRFSSTNFFPRVTVLRDLSVSRGSFRSFDEYFCECCFPFVSDLFIAEILQLSGRRFGKDERYIFTRGFASRFCFLIFVSCIFFLN